MDFAEVFPFNEVLQDDIYNYVQENDRPDFDKSEPELVKEFQSPRIGLTTKQANNRIIAIMNDTLNRCENKINLDVLLLELFKLDFILNMIAFLLLLSCLIYILSVNKRSEFTNEIWEYVLEVIMYIPWLVLNVYVKIIIKLNKENKKGNRIREILNFLYISGGSSGVDMEYKGYNMDPPSSDFVPVYRDLEWVRLPRNVLVKGDIFKLQLNQVFPCDCKLVLNYLDDDLVLNDELYREGDKCKFLGTNIDNEKFIDGTFLALNDSFTSYLEAFIARPGFREAYKTKETHKKGIKTNNKNKNNKYNQQNTEDNQKEKNEQKNENNTNTNNNNVKQEVENKEKQYVNENASVRKEVIWNYNDNYIFLNHNNKMLIMVVLVITVILNVFWNFIYDVENKICVLLNLTRLLILFEFIGFEPVQKLSELWGNVKLLSIFEIYHEHRFLKDLDPVRSLSSSSFLTNSSYDSVSSDLLVDEITFSFQFKQLSRVLQKGLFEEGSLIRQMSCITLLCFIDDIGILLNSNQSLQEISIITSNRGPGNQDATMDVDNKSTNTSYEENVEDNNNTNNKEKQEKEKEQKKTKEQKEEETSPKKYTDKEEAKKGELKHVNSGSHLEVLENENEDEDDDDLLILDIFNDINLYGKDNIRFTNEYEKNCKNLLKPLIFSMSLTSIPTYISSYTYSVHGGNREVFGKGLEKRESNFNMQDRNTRESIEQSYRVENEQKTKENDTNNKENNKKERKSRESRERRRTEEQNRKKYTEKEETKGSRDITPRSENEDGREYLQPRSLSSSCGHGDSNSISRDNSFRNREIVDAAQREIEEALNREHLEKQKLSQQILRGDQILGKNRLYKNYISMLINNELDNFNNCLCTLTNVLGIKKLYLKRYKLLKFVLFNFSNQNNSDYIQKKAENGVNNNNTLRIINTSSTFINNGNGKDLVFGDSPVSMVGRTKEMLLEAERQLETGDDSKILIYFYRDVNKKIIQMLIKCKISILNNYRLNYYNGRKITSLNKRIKRKIKDLNIQWLSNGMNTFFYFYKPISINDFNILLLLLPYITVYNISSVSNLPRESGSSSSSGSSGGGSSRSTIIRKNERKSVYMYMYKKNRLYYKYKGINILQLSKIYRSQGPAEDGSVTPRPSSKNEFSNDEKLKQAVEKSTEVRENRYKVDKDIILGSYIGEMLNSYIKNSILLGMVGTKYNLPKEISNRINDLHEAGIRFVYFSKHNEKVTRIIGGLLGLETSWNSMISLSTSETSSFINQEGHMVLPNGINNIRQHIQQVDDIPLQVSLFCNSNCSNITEMLDILSENGENIMCIGSGLNPNNFYLFNNSHLSFSISLNYNPICKFCKGKRWQGISKAHIFEEPKPEFKLSSLITSLTCSLQTTHLYKVSDPDFVFEMLYELFKEARNVSTNLQECTSFMLLCYYSLIWMFFLQHLFSLPPIFTTFDLSMIVFVYIPYLSMTLLCNPVMDKIMEHLPNKVTRKHQITYKNFIRTYLRLLVMSSFVVLVYYTHIYYTNSYISNKFNLSAKHCSNYFYYPRLYCVDHVINYLKKETKMYDPHICLILSQNFTSISFVLFLIVTSISWINKYSYINLETFTNVNWTIAVVLILTFQISIVVIKMILLNLQDSKLMKLMVVNSSYTLLLTIPILAIDQVIKIFIIKDKNTQQKFLQLLFSTRLGTWSPK